MARQWWAVALALIVYSVDAFTVDLLTDPNIPPGFIVDGSCSVQMNEAIVAGLTTAQQYLAAAETAAESQDQTLLNFFFHSTDKRFVSRTFGRLNRIGGQLEKTTVLFYCPPAGAQDCNYANFHRFPQIEQAGLTPKNNIVSVCPNFLTAVSSTEANPCKQSDLDFDLYNNVGALSWGLVMLHELLHLPYLGGPEYDVLLDIAKTASDAHALTTPSAYSMSFDGIPSDQVQPIWSVNNYIIFAKWAYIQQQQRTQCASIPSLWGALDDDDPDSRVELRRLLGEPDSPDATQTFESTNVVNYDTPSLDKSFYSNATFGGKFNISGVAYRIVNGLDYSGLRPSSDSASVSVTLHYNNTLP